METTNHKKLYRSTTDRKMAGLCGGLAEYFNVDSNALRFGWIVIVILTGIFPGVLAYIVGIFVVPISPISKVY